VRHPEIWLIRGFSEIFISFMKSLTIVLWEEGALIIRIWYGVCCLTKSLKNILLTLRVSPCKHLATKPSLMIGSIKVNIPNVHFSGCSTCFKAKFILKLGVLGRHFRLFLGITYIFSKNLV
jgi:hypothetical protein